MTALRDIRYRVSRDVGRNSVWLPPREHAVELVPEMCVLDARREMPGKRKSHAVVHKTMLFLTTESQYKKTKHGDPPCWACSVQSFFQAFFQLIFF
jgi:hypothetical protein